ncbi:hypothetical protein B0H13DRAFT_2375196 [Mycena leptocephala]|nr:hypothetical protein B0H13DRAFT_2375196 [Mycena leptocephala]
MPFTNASPPFTPTVFTVPAAFVHVSFANYAATEHYMGGKKRTGTINLVLGNVRQGPSRARDLYVSLCRQIEAGMDSQRRRPRDAGCGARDLGGVFVMGPVTAAYEQAKFQALADDGNEFCRDMIAELRTREDFKLVFGNGSA